MVTETIFGMLYGTIERYDAAFANLTVCVSPVPKFAKSLHVAGVFLHLVPVAVHGATPKL